MWSYVPTEGYDPTLLLFNGGIALYVTIVAVVSIVISGIAFYPLRYRKIPAVIHRTTYLSLLNLPFILWPIPWCFYRLLVSPYVSCFFDLWSFSISVLPGLIINLARFVHMLHVYKLKEALLDAANHGAMTMDYEKVVTLLPDPSWGSDQGSSTNMISGARKAPEDPEVIQYLEDLAGDAWWFKYRAYLTERSLFFICLSIIFGVLVLLAIITGIHGGYPSDTPYALGQCMVDWPNWPIFVLDVGLKSLLYPLIFFYLREVNDAYGIRREFEVFGSLNAIAVVLYFVTIWIPALNQATRTSLFLVAVVVFVANNVYTTYILPLRDVLKSRRHSRSGKMTMQSLRKLLDTPEGFSSFLHYSVRDFSVENPLFYRRYHQIADRVAQSRKMIRASMDSEVLAGKVEHSETLHNELGQELWGVYTNFLRVGAHYELNVPREKVGRVERELRARDYRLEILDDILHDVCLVMFQHTYPRFLDKQGTRRRPQSVPVRQSYFPFA
ncbi:hypothetical protein BJ684DRAFT_20452 [Piptocephalis cylindrospora]|uniref:RGS domain-containing protein n=1 Tax=Piptocephalis cylindrospora TaxID=1907219 RepID=A0A4P9Y2Z3_9FUNG|nr:hypothetical protein BJ684DRAFT_20452 [Piptocephalis cylindrospora]|eukprot:RKP13034.1 hypothetical protein BJ684DRAFT_20452 [Piptocephalis cylindrospora]